MNISVERLPECKARLSAEIPAATVKDLRGKIVAEFSRKAKIPGFRPGKIPGKVIEKRYAEAVDEELKERLANIALRGAMEREKLGILGFSSIEREQFGGEGEYYFAAEVVTEAEVEVKDYKGIPVKAPRLEVTDGMVDEFVERLRQERAEGEDADGPAAPGMGAGLSYSGTLEGRPLSELVEGPLEILAGKPDYRILLPGEGEDPAGNREVIPGLSAAVLGMSPGETKTFETTLPENLPAEAVAGKSVTYEVTLDSLIRFVPPELNEDFAAAAGFASLEELREAVRERIRREQERARRELIDRQIIAYLNEETSVDLPPHLVLNETQRQVDQMVMRGIEQGMSEEEIAQHESDIVKDAENSARLNVKTSAILQTIAENEGIEVADREILNVLAAAAEREGRPLKKVAREINEARGIDGIRLQLLQAKTIEFLRDNASVTELDPPAPGGE